MGSPLDHPPGGDAQVTTGVYELEAGVDRAAQVLQRYNRQTGEWDFEKSGDFWVAVQMSHALGRSGDGVKVAVVDGAFDTTITSLSLQSLQWPNDSAASTVHGTVVALLVLEVAPACEMFMYPVSVQGVMSSELMVRAIDDAVACGADVINLSFGMGLAIADTFDAEGFFGGAGYSSAMSDDDRQFWSRQRLSAHPLREWLSPPSTPVSQAVDRACAAGVSVIAAAGNNKDSLFTPAVQPSAFAIGFGREMRSVVSSMERADLGKPTFSQSMFADLILIQPEGLLGSSFATPLVAGFVSLIQDRTQFGGFRDSVRLAGMAHELWQICDSGPQEWSPTRQGILDDLFKAAVTTSPHRHYQQSTVEPCATCSFLMLQAYVDYGLFKLNWQDLGGAKILLETVRQFAPNSAFAAANLAVTYAAIADSTEQSSVDERRQLLALAAHHMAAAVQLRPQHVPYQQRLDEFQAAAADPAGWVLENH